MKKGPEERIELSEAARWYLERQGEGSAARTARFAAWRDRSADNAAEYARCESVIEAARELHSDPELQALYGECRSLADAWRSSGAAVATRHRRRLFAGVSLLAASLAAVAIVAVQWSNRPVPARYHTAIGEQRTIITPDDSVITLNTDTELAVEFDGAVRRIRLERGQVFFSVTPDPQRPFEVFAHDGIVRAVGTSFDVALDDANQVTVTVLEGTVEVMPGASQNPASTAASPPKVTHGEKVKYWQNGAIAQVTSADATAVRAWREGKLDFDNQRLDDAIAEHNRYTSTKIIVGDDELKGLRISGVFRIGDTESLLFLLKESLGVTTVKKANVIVLLPNRKLREAEQPVAPGEAARG